MHLFRGGFMNELNAAAGRTDSIMFQGINTRMSGVKPEERNQLGNLIAAGCIIGKEITAGSLPNSVKIIVKIIDKQTEQGFLLCMSDDGRSCVLQKKMPGGAFPKELEQWTKNLANSDKEANKGLLSELIKNKAITDEQLASFCAAVGIEGRGDYFFTLDRGRGPQQTALMDLISSERPGLFAWMEHDFKYIISDSAAPPKGVPFSLANVDLRFVVGNLSDELRELLEDHWGKVPYGSLMDVVFGRPRISDKDIIDFFVRIGIPSSIVELDQKGNLDPDSEQLSTSLRGLLVGDHASRPQLLAKWKAAEAQRE